MRNLERYILSIFTVLCLSVYGQEKEDNRIGWDATRKLTWDDFQGTPVKSMGFYALTMGGIRYEFVQEGEKYDVQLYVYFNPEASWQIKEKNTEELLKHEQTHFDIYELFGRKLAQALSKSAPFEEEKMSDQIMRIFNDNFDAAVKYQEKYDKETHHSTKQEEQNEWDEKVSKELADLNRFSTKRVPVLY